MTLPRLAREPPALRMPAPEHSPGPASAGAATLIYSGTPEWNAWINRCAATLPKQHAAMMAAMATVARARARWLLPLLLEIFSSDIASEDVTIDQSEQRTAVLIRGATVREFTMRAMYTVPSPMPPPAPAGPQLLKRIDGGDEVPKPPEPAPLSPLKLDEETRSILEGARTLRGKQRAARNEAELDATRRRRALAAIEEATLTAALEAAKHDDFPDVEASELLDTILVPDPLEAFDQELIGAGPAMKTPRKDVPPRRRVIALRDDPIGRMAKRGQLHDWKPPAQLAELCGRRNSLEGALDALPVIDRQTSPGEVKRIERRRRQVADELRGVETEIAAIREAENARAEEQKQTRLYAARFYEKLYGAVEIGGARAIDPFREVVDGGRFITPDTDIRLAAQRRLAKIDAAVGRDAVDLVRAVLVQKWEIGQVADAKGDDTARYQRQLRQQLCAGLDKISRFVPETPRPASFRSARDVYASLAVVASNVSAHGVLLAAIEAARIK
jgi:hypothetical protein